MGLITGRAGRVAGAVAVLAIPFLPKCPVCVLPFLAAAGIALPHGPLVEALILGALAAWLGVVLTTARWLPLRLAACGAAVLLLVGRALSADLLSAAGAVSMFAVALWTLWRPRRCHG